MPFFWQLEIQETNKSKKNKPSLRDKKPDSYSVEIKRNISTFLKKRVSSFISTHIVKGSITLEATMIVPFFLFAIFSLISIMDMMRVKACIDIAVTEIGNEIVTECYDGYRESIYIPLFIQNKISLFLKNNLSENNQKKVLEEIVVTNVSFSEEENIFSFKVKYKLKPQFDMWGFIKVNLEANYYGHVWLGYKEHSEIEPMVFLSNEASVYHISKNCRYLNVTILEISKSYLEGYRNNDGEKYKSCSFCDGLNETETIFITPEGNNYHKIKNCIGLTRYIYTVPKSTVGDKKICTGCKE